MPEFTYRQILSALEVNGYKQGFFHLLEDDTEGEDWQVDNLKGNILNACAIGQICLNLGVRTLDLPNEEVLFIIGSNDGKRLNIKRIHTALKKRWKDRLDQKVTLEFQDWSGYKNYQGIKVK